MSITSFWLIRHALVEENARAMLYGVMDVPLCETTLLEQAPMYQALAARLPRPALWKISPLSRTRRTAETIFAAGYPPATLGVEPDVIEQSLGDWQGLPHADLPAKLEYGAHAFWPLRSNERPPGGESLIQVTARVGQTLDRLAPQAHALGKLLVVSHHDFEATPAYEALAEAARRAVEAGADVVKIATQVNDDADIATLARLLQEKAAPRLVVIGMGERGVPTRLMFPRDGSLFTFAAKGDRASAPGQIAYGRMAALLGITAPEPSLDA